MQAHIIDGLLIKLNTSSNCLINLDIPEDVSVARLLKRDKTSEQLDDNEVVTRSRLRGYHDQTLPILRFYGGNGKRHDVDGTRSVEEVRADIVQIFRESEEKDRYYAGRKHAFNS